MNQQTIQYEFDVIDKNNLAVIIIFTVYGEAPKTIDRTWEIREYIEELLLKYDSLNNFEIGLDIILSGILEVSMYSKLNITYKTEKFVSGNYEGLPDFVLYYEVHELEKLMDIKIEVTRNAN